MNKFLLDTNAWIFVEESNDKIGKRASSILSDYKVERYVSAASSLEIAQLAFKGKFKVSQNVNEWITESLRIFALQELDISSKICIEAYNLPGEFHPDPMDRILVATARLYGLTIITSDRKILSYEYVKSLDVGL